MGKPTGFMEHDRQLPPKATGTGADQGFQGDLSAFSRVDLARAGRPLHGLRGAHLPRRMSLG